MARILGHGVLILASLFWFLGCSPSTMRWFSAQGWMADDYRFGDLYRFSYLAEFRSPRETCTTVPPPVKQPDTHLVLLGDSFTEPGRVGAENFGFANFTRLHIAEGGACQLNPAQRNILVLETVERHFQERFQSPYHALTLNSGKATSPTSNTSWLDWRLPYDEERHQAFLFSSEFFLTIKECKAWINHKVLGRVDDHVFLSPDQQHLFYHVDQEAGLTNGFAPIPNSAVSTYIASLNATRDRYLSMGFEEVYLSIIPNKSSILGRDTGEYNRLVERIQTHPDLRMPFLDMWSPMEKLKTRGYAKGDTHWTCEGQKAWVDQVNQLVQTSP